MPITVKCPCGREFTVDGGAAGREAFCPGCRQAVAVPQTPPVSPTPTAPPTAPAPPALSPASSPAGGVEVFPNKIKFHCECGQKISVPLPAPSSAGTCPRCKRSLTVPKVPGQPRAAPQPVAPAAPAAKVDAPIAVEAARPAPAAPTHCSKCGRRIESAGAAFCPRCGFPLALAMSPALKIAQPAARQGDTSRPARPAHEPSRPQVIKLPAPPPRPPPAVPVPVTGRPAGAMRRLAAFALDTAAAVAVGLAGALAAGSLGQGSAGILAVLIGGGIFLVLNGALFAALAGARSIGMLATGICVMTCEGRPAGFPLLLARLMAFITFSIGVPLALIDQQRRTLHDIICGTVVRCTGGT